MSVRWAWELQSQLTHRVRSTRPNNSNEAPNWITLHDLVDLSGAAVKSRLPRQTETQARGLCWHNSLGTLSQSTPRRIADLVLVETSKLLLRLTHWPASF